MVNGEWIMDNGGWLMMTEFLRKFVSGNAENTGKCYRFLLDNPDEYRDKVCIRKCIYSVGQLQGA
jgi:hypothetical protein